MFLITSAESSNSNANSEQWVDQDEQNEVPDEDYMANFGGEDGGFGGIDFSKLGGGAGSDMPGMEGLGGDEGDENDDEDDEMPDLEDEDEGAEKESEPSKGKGARKIEEVS